MSDIPSLSDKSELGANVCLLFCTHSSVPLLYILYWPKTKVDPPSAPANSSHGSPNNKQKFIITSQCHYWPTDCCLQSGFCFLAANTSRQCHRAREALTSIRRLMVEKKKKTALCTFLVLTSFHPSVFTFCRTRLGSHGWNIWFGFYYTVIGKSKLLRGQRFVKYRNES